AAFLAGMASHESMGCKTSAKDWAGGRGVMQITSPPTPAQKKRVAAMLGIKVSKLDWTRNDLHSVLMGAVFLTDYESELGSRPHGLLAYNMGAGGVRKHARMTGWKSGALPSLLTIAPHLRYERRMKPRTYVWRVLTHVVLIDRLKNGLQIEMNRGIVPADIPGWDPRDDIH
ncbi:MAG: transglycosylase SLT domain-containing protein, partial [bacterium]|nr:transglycosylase SLT domain-containing protein [bacterium]